MKIESNDTIFIVLSNCSDPYIIYFFEFDNPIYIFLSCILLDKKIYWRYVFIPLHCQKSIKDSIYKGSWNSWMFAGCGKIIVPTEI